MTTPNLTASDHVPILYSFRRCPYAIRARLALATTQHPVLLREVKLAEKPQGLLQVSPKGTVPVLVLGDGHVLEESRNIMEWALSLLDPTHPWRAGTSLEDPLLERNDNEFKHWLDRYKYADRYPEHSAEYYRSHGEAFLASLERRLEQAPWLSGAYGGALDAAIMPFVRQFATVDRQWFEQTPYRAVRRWLQGWLQSPLFIGVMGKWNPWKTDDQPLLWPPDPIALANEARRFSMSTITSSF